MATQKRHNFKKLKIWQLAMEIANDVSDLLQNFPKHEKYDLSSQLGRCSVSVPSNIAEGSARSDKSFSNFLKMSLGSSYELNTQLLISRHRNYISQEELEKMEQKIDEFQKMTFSFQDGLDS